ncbi:MAG: hypothetical protein M3Q44_01130 [bacterium]|nr:hypothetical protein [bacterium]
MAVQSPIKASTQEHLEIDDIFDDMVILKNNGASLVIQTTAVNFGLLSEPEQDAIIYAYAGLLNSLSFPIQIVVRSKRMDVSSYLESLIKWEQKQVNEKIRIQIRKYREFISSTIRENNVLDKRFYVVIPMFPEEIGLGATSPLGFGKQNKTPRYSKEYIVDRAKNILLPKRDHLMRQLTRLGLKASHLSTQQLIELFYDIYNPAVTGAQRLATRSDEYLSPIVSSAAEIRQHAPSQLQKPDALASEMSPAAIFENNTGNSSSLPSQQMNAADQKPQGTLPQTPWNQTIQNSQAPWPAPPAPSSKTQTPFTQGMETNNPLQEISPTSPVQINPQTQNTNPITANPDQVILNLQKAIEEARRKNSQ